MAFQPPQWLSNRHVQTIWPYIMSRYQYVTYTRERFDIEDGDFIDIDWYGGYTGKVVLLCHGMGGSSQSHYVKQTVLYLQTLGYCCAVLNFRGCSGSPNRLLRGYHSGDTNDIDYVISMLQSRYPEGVLHVVGFSLGGNVLLKWLGEQRGEVHKAVAISVPFDLKVAEALSVKHLID